MIVVCGADARYVQPLTVMLRSVFANLATDRSARVYVLDGGVDAAGRDALARSLGAHAEAVSWIPARDGAPAGAPLWGSMSPATYLKLGVAELLPADVQRAIWLDSDLVVTSDLGSLWDEELDGHHVLAAQDAVVPHVSSYCGVAAHAELGLQSAAKYFNAGVMVADLALWRRDDVRAQAIDYLRAHRRDVCFWDQEALNAVLANRWRALDPCWNLNTSVPARWIPRDIAACAQPRILHYAGSLKPWRYPHGDALRRVYFDYLDSTVWRGWRPRPTPASLLVGLYEASRLRALLYPLERITLWLRRRRRRRRVPAPGGTTP